MSELTSGTAFLTKHTYKNAYFIRKWERDRPSLTQLSLKANGFSLKLLKLNWVDLGFFFFFFFNLFYFLFIHCKKKWIKSLDF
jgi:hypothetical protein